MKNIYKNILFLKPQFYYINYIMCFSKICYVQNKYITPQIVFPVAILNTPNNLLIYSDLNINP